MSGTLYGVGVGPGDPKLMTFLAAETIEKCPVIAVPAADRELAVSYRIAGGIVKGIGQKECLNLAIPMTKDQQVLKEKYEQDAELIIQKLQEGKDVAYLTIGDPTIYSTYIYLHRLIQKQGYPAEIISGIPSFCAAAARVGESLADRSEQLHIIPSNYGIDRTLDYPGVKVLMKAGSKLSSVRQIMKEKGMRGVVVENCGFLDEHIYYDMEMAPEETSYYTTVLIR